MSDDEQSDVSADDEDLNRTGLIATRAKRATAGNLYATLRANLDDEELQKELLAEDEEDQGDYEGSDRDDDDEAMESSSDEEDAGPPKHGETEDLAGEKELKQQERAENRKKRKMDEIRTRLPIWQKKKRVKLADDVKTEDSSAPERPKKKSERSNWLPTVADMPVRQSARASAIANREVVHTNLKESALRSEKQKRVMANHAERTYANKRADLTQEERLAKATRIEKETAREFGRWEREEAERQRIREEQLAAKRNTGIDGPFIRQWSGSVLWEGEKIKSKRMHGSKNLDELADDPKEPIGDAMMGDINTANTLCKPASTTEALRSPPGSVTSSVQPQQQISDTKTEQQPLPDQPLALAPVSWLAGIQEYAAQAPSEPHSIGLQQNTYKPSAPAINGTFTPSQAEAVQQQSLTLQSTQSTDPYTNPPPPPVYHGLSFGHQQNAPQQSYTPNLNVPSPPLVKEQAQRSLIMLEQFEHLDTTVTTKRGMTKASKDSALEPTPIASTLFSLSYPTFSPEQSRYLTARMKKLGGTYNLPPAPTKTRCALTSWPAKFRDPKTGLPYADLQTFKMIQRMLAGGCAWSALLGAWSGPHYGSMGRAATGVPEGFGAPAPVPVLKDSTAEVST